MSKEGNIVVESSVESKKLSSLREIVDGKITLSGRIESDGVNFSSIEVLGMNSPPSIVESKRILPENSAILELVKQLELFKIVTSGKKDISSELDSLMNIRYLSQEELEFGVLDQIISASSEIKEGEKLTLIGFGDNGESYCASLINELVKNADEGDVFMLEAIKNFLVVVEDKNELKNKVKGPVLRIGLSDKVSDDLGFEGAVNNVYLVGSGKECIYELGSDEVVLGPVMIDVESVDKANEWYEKASQTVFEGMSVVRPAILNPVSV